MPSKNSDNCQHVKTSRTSAASDNSRLRVLFMGTPEFALPGLSALIADQRFEIIGVYTRADKPVGRKQALTPPPIKLLAQAHGLSVFQPEKIKPEAEAIYALKPDLIVVIAYGKIIPQTILDIPRYGCINVHASLLPKYRGSACLSAPILNGDKETGVTIMQMDAGLDTGPILRQAAMPLKGKETLAQVHDYLSELGAKLLPEALLAWVCGQIKPQPQNDALASYVKMLSKEDGRLDWQQSAEELERKWRGLHPWPGIHAFDERGKMIKLLEVAWLAESKLAGNSQKERVATNEKKLEKNGEVSLKNDKLAVKCGQDYLIILKLQTEGGRPLSAKEFLAGHQHFIGQILK